MIGVSTIHVRYLAESLECSGWHGSEALVNVETTPWSGPGKQLTNPCTAAGESALL